jgi:hypothetical protein
MKTASKTTPNALSKFLKKKIINSESITGGTNGPIDRDKIKIPTRR